jgi:serine/threonine protein kinase
MPIQVKCSNEACLKPLAAPDELAGKVVKCPACGTELSVPAARMLGEYQLVRRIGLGGMGAVYEAIQLKLGRRVALKVLDSTLGENKRFLERFMREARTAASIVHPNVIQVFDFGEDDGQHYFAMEFVEGEDVRQRMQREGRLPLGDALGMVEDVAKVLQAAHKASIIHRDIKPENIMLSSDGMVKLADLGLAKNIEEDTTITQSGAGIGTPYYMAPEQAEDAANVDHRADIYALGISLLHMLTGTYPFDGENPWEIVEKHKKRPLPSGADLGQELPAEVEFLIQKMARKTLDQRYQDYDTLLSDLAEVKSGGKPKGFIAAPGQPLKRRRLDSTAAKRRGGLSALTLVAAASLGVIGVATFMLVSEDPPEPAPLRRTTTVGRKSQTRPKVVKKNLTGDIEAYAAINPHQYSEIITQFDALLKTVSSSQRAEVQAKRKAWGELWRAAAEEEFRTRKQISENQLSARSFTEAEELWIGFPANLRHHSVEAMIGSEVKRIEALKDQIVAQLQSEARGWTSLRTESITREQLASLQAFHRKLVRSAQGLNAEQTKIIEDLAANISAKISAREAVLERLKIQEKDFWKRYVRQMRIGSFDAAREFVRETSALDEPVRKRLLSDTDLVAGFKEKAEKNLPRLVGTWVRLRGTRVKVTSVKEDRLYAKQGEVELGM